MNMPVLHITYPESTLVTGYAAERLAVFSTAAALAGYLRDAGWPHPGAIDVIQGEDVGAPSSLHAAISLVGGSSARNSGTVRALAV